MSHAFIHNLPSERSFGFLFAFVFIALGAYGLLQGWNREANLAGLIAGSLVTLIAIFSPGLLTPLNKAWFRFGQLLNKITQPIILGILFFGILTPIALILRLAGRDELRLKPRKNASYWIDRAPLDPRPDSFKNQF